MNRKVRFGLRLKALRRQRELTQEQLAELIDRSVDAISKMERGQTLPNLETLMRLSEKLGVPLKDLVDPIDDSRKMDKERLELEASLIETIRSLNSRVLAVAADVLRVLAKHGKAGEDEVSVGNRERDNQPS